MLRFITAVTIFMLISPVQASVDIKKWNNPSCSGPAFTELTVEDHVCKKVDTGSIIVSCFNVDGGIAFFKSYVVDDCYNSPTVDFIKTYMIDGKSCISHGSSSMKIDCNFNSADTLVVSLSSLFLAVGLSLIGCF